VDCGRCEPVCPVVSIYHEDDLPDEKSGFAAINASMFAEIGTPGGARKVEPFAVDYAGIARSESA
jgi:ferredoxin